MTTILIVDDQSDNRSVLERLLRSWGYDVIEAQDGVTAVQLARQRLPDLVLLDVMMPNMDGFAVLRSLRGVRRPKRSPSYCSQVKPPTNAIRFTD